MSENFNPRYFELSPHSIWHDSSLESLDWESKERAAQFQALVLMRDHWENGIDIPILEYPWSDAEYPSVVKVWGIDRFEEDAAFYLDQVWLKRWYLDTPQEWLVIAATTDEKPLSRIELSDGTWAEEGSRAYLDARLTQMRNCSEQYARQLGTVLTHALKTYQLQYRHLHSVYAPNTRELQIDSYYDFPIYPTTN